MNFNNFKLADLLLEDYVELDEKSQVKKYFVICTMYDEIVAYGPINSLTADDAMCDFFDNTNIAYSGEYEDADGEFDWDGLTRYVWQVEDDLVLPQTDEEAQNWLETEVDKNTIIESQDVRPDATGTTASVANALVSEYEDNLNEAALKEYTSLQGWQDEIDQIQTEEDAKKIPQWVLDQLGMTRAQIMPKAPKPMPEPNTKPQSTGSAVKDYTDDKAAAKFWNYAKQNIIDYDSFQQAYGAALKAAGLPEDAWYDGHVTNVYVHYLINPDVIKLAPEERIIEVNAKHLHGAQTWFKYIKKLDDKLASVRALKKLWTLQFKTSGAKSLGEVEIETKYKQKQADAEKFFAEVLAAIRAKLQSYTPKDEVETEAIKTITNPESKFTLYMRTYGEDYPYMSVHWYTAWTPFSGQGNSVAVKYPGYTGDLEKVVSEGADKLATFFVTEFTNGNWADGNREKLFPGEQPEKKD